MKDRGVPIDGVGFQMHLMARDPVQEEAVRANIRRFTDLGLFVSFTEIDVRVALPLDAEKEAQQTAVYTKLMEIARSEKNTGSYILWGYTDKKSWIPRFFQGFGSAHLFDNNNKPKPAFESLKAMLSVPSPK
jgi:endo-1,4-beta-xylanase